MHRRLWRAQEALEESDLGRIVISALVIVALVAVIAANLPDSHLKRRLTDVADPAIDATGLVQVWGVFAPDPRRTIVAMEGRVRFADGSTETWREPTGSPFVDAYSLAHWRKYVEFTIRDDYAGVLWEPTAAWIAKESARGGRSPVEVKPRPSLDRALPTGRRAVPVEMA